MYTVHLDTLGMTHDFQCIADISSLEIIKTGPFLTLPLLKNKHLKMNFQPFSLRIVKYHFSINLPSAPYYLFPLSLHQQNLHATLL